MRSPVRIRAPRFICAYLQGFCEEGSGRGSGAWIVGIGVADRDPFEFLAGEVPPPDRIPGQAGRQLEAPASLRRCLGRDHLANDPECAFAVADPGCSPQERAEVQEQLQRVGGLIVDQLTARQRAVVIAIDGVSTATLAAEPETARGAIYKTLHDARKKLTAQLAFCCAERLRMFKRTLQCPVVVSIGE